MRDLEIRGAGSLLGEIQHGHMDQIGYDMYCELLNQVVKEIQGEEVIEEIDIQIDLDVTSYIPEEYIKILAKKSKYIKILLYVKMKKTFKILQMKL